MNPTKNFPNVYILFIPKELATIFYSIFKKIIYFFERKLFRILASVSQL